MTHVFRLTATAFGLALAAGAVDASPLPVALFDSSGTMSFSAQGGLVITGGLTAEYNGAPNGTRPYVVEASLETGNAKLTPSVTVGSPDLSIPGIPGSEVCVFGVCTTLPGTSDIPVPSVSQTFDLPIPLPLDVSLFDESWTSPPVPLGQALAFDFGNMLIGQSLSIGDMVRDQFEQGATDWSFAGSLGPIDGTIDYFGTLAGNTISATYELVIAAPAILGQLEDQALGLLNDNVGLFADLAIEAFLGNIDCESLTGAFLCNIVRDLPIGDDGLNIALNSLGTLSADYHFSKMIAPAPIPLPASLPLLLAGTALLAVFRRRRREG